MELKTVQTQKIYKNIVEQIVDLIHDGSLKEGDRLPPERTLAEMLQVSRTSVREALKVMEIMGHHRDKARRGLRCFGFQC